jgi:hypothetical protein
MPSKNKGDSSPPPEANQPSLQQPVFSIISDENTSTFYINCAEVASNAYEFAILATRMPTKPPQEHIDEIKAGRKIEISADVQIIFASTLMPDIIKALLIQKDFYEKMLGEIKTPEMKGDLK